MYESVGTGCALIVSWRIWGLAHQSLSCIFFSCCLDGLLLSRFVTDMCFQPGCHAVVSGWLAVDRGRETIIKSQIPRAAGIYDRRCPGCQARLIWCSTSKLNPNQLLIFIYTTCVSFLIGSWQGFFFSEERQNITGFSLTNVFDALSLLVQKLAC